MITRLLSAFAILFALASTVSAADWPGEPGKWHDFVQHRFEVDGRPCYVVLPRNAAPGKPWVWRARFPGFHAEADLVLLSRGFHVAYLNTDGMLGSPRAMKHWDAFWSFMTKRGLSKRVALEGVSRGGLFVYGFASRWPERVACVYADTPVCDIKSWPGGKGKGRGSSGTWTGLLAEYGFTEEQALTYRGNPIDTLAPLAKAKIPLLHIISLNDVIVPPAENTLVLAERYRKLDGSIDIIEVKEGTKRSGGHHFKHPDPVRVADFIERHATALPGQTDYFVLRGALDNCRIRFEGEKKGRVAFLGGSITQGSGWRNQVMEYLKQRFPRTEFDFIGAGIASTGTTPGAFRLSTDVLTKGRVDLLFEEAAVNDLHNGRTPVEMTRGMEGIVRHARIANPAMDVVMMHFVDPQNFNDYQKKRVPPVITRHERVAVHYGVPSIHLAREVFERIEAKQFTWKDDFRNLHPSPFGHRLYSSTIRRTLSAAWEKPLEPGAKILPHPVPREIDRHSYTAGKYVSIKAAGERNGFAILEKCDPRAGGVGGGVRGGFFNVPMLVGTKPGDAFEMAFSGRAVGLFVAAGPDAGIVEYSIDGGDWKKQDLFTKWSGRLHLPWAYVLASELERGKHTLAVRIAADRNSRSKGHACRVVHLLVNE